MGKKKGKANAVKKQATKKDAKKKSRAKSPAKTKSPADFVEVRKVIATLVRGSAREIARKVIEVAKLGQLAPAKYLFEAVGLYPPTEETAGPSQDNSLAFTLLKRMGLPTEPVITEEDPDAPVPKFSLKPRLSKAAEVEGGSGSGWSRKAGKLRPSNMARWPKVRNRSPGERRRRDAVK